MMKRGTLITILTLIMVMSCSLFSFADGGFELTASYPEDGQTNTSMENLGVKLNFSKAVNSEEAKTIDESKVAIYDEDGAEVPVKVLFSDSDDGLVLVVADVDGGFVAKNNSEYKLVIDADFVDNDGDVLGKETTITFKTYNQKVNNMVNMAMMFIMFGGIMVLTMKQNNDKKEEEEDKKKTENKEAFNPYKEAKKSGKTIEEVMAEQAKKEEKLAKKRARKNKDSDTQTEGKIENCAELLTNVYHVHAPAPVSKEDRSMNALTAMRRAEARAAKAEKAEQQAKYKKRRH